MPALTRTTQPSTDDKASPNPVNYHSQLAPHWSVVVQRAEASPEPLTTSDIHTLQRSIGNRATVDLLSRHTGLQAKLKLGPAGDKYEQEADRVASQVVRQADTPRPVQRMDEEEQMAQAKPFSPGSQFQPNQAALPKQSFVKTNGDLKPTAPSPIQRASSPKRGFVLRQTEEDDELAQLKPMHGPQGGEVESSVAQQIQAARGHGHPLADSVRTKMEQGFGADFSGVRIHTGGQADTLNRSLNARAFTVGKDVFFRQGEYTPGSSGGQTLLAHELTHTVQQGAATVQRETVQRDGEDEEEMTPEQIKTVAFQVRLALTETFSWWHLKSSGAIGIRTVVEVPDQIKNLTTNLPNDLKDQYGKFFSAIRGLMVDSSIYDEARKFSGKRGSTLKKQTQNANNAEDKQAGFNADYKAATKSYVEDGKGYLKAKFSKGIMGRHLSNLFSSKRKLRRSLMPDVAESASFETLQKEYDALRNLLEGKEASIRSSDVRKRYKQVLIEDKQRTERKNMTNLDQEQTKRYIKLFDEPAAGAKGNLSRSLMTVLQKYKATMIAGQLQKDLEKTLNEIDTADKI